MARARPADLARQLQRGLAPIYLVSGDEPLQAGEAADAIRAAARAAGYANRVVLEVGGGFDWNTVTQEAHSLSLFAEQKIIDLRIPGGNPGKEGGRVLEALAEQPAPDTLLLLTLPKLDRRQQGARWFKALEARGVLVQVWPIEGSQLVSWVEARLRAAGLHPGPEVADILAARVEGNLLAASQEIEKLLLLHEPGPLSAEQLDSAVADNARFDVFGLVDSTLQGDPARSLRMAAGLRAEGVAAPVVLWAVAREVRALLPLTRAVADGVPIERALASARVWDKRKPLVRRAVDRLDPAHGEHLLTRCQAIDAAIKGAGGDDPWRQLDGVLLELAGAPLGV